MLENRFVRASRTGRFIFPNFVARVVDDKRVEIGGKVYEAEELELMFRGLLFFGDNARYVRDGNDVRIYGRVDNMIEFLGWLKNVVDQEFERDERRFVCYHKDFGILAVKGNKKEIERMYEAGLIGENIVRVVEDEKYLFVMVEWEEW